MIRSQLAQRAPEEGFRWRGTEVSRLEGFVDAVFGFAVTLLVASLEVPRTFDQLMAAMRGFVAFAICFAVLFMLWYRHYRFCRRYGLQDLTTHLLSAVLVFVVLFYIYPLKFLFVSLTRVFLGMPPERLADGSLAYAVVPSQGPALMVIYGVGYTAVFAVFFLLYLHAYRQREALELTPLERLKTRASLTGALCVGWVGLLSIALVWIGGERWTGVAGWVYFLASLSSTAHGIWFGRRERRLLTTS